MWALAQTDHANINGALHHMKACERVGIQPLMGLEAYYRPTIIRDKENQHKRWHMILIAKDLVGWHNLIKISSASYRPENFFQYPSVTDELLSQYSEGLYCTTACIVGYLAYLIENFTDAEVDAWLMKMLGWFGDRLRIEIQPHDFERQVAYNLAVVAKAMQFGIPITVGGDAHYVYDDPKTPWSETQKLSILMSTNTTVKEWEEKQAKKVAEGKDAYEYWHDGMHLHSEQEVIAKFVANHPRLPASIVEAAVAENENIARNCAPFLLDRSLKMPKYKGGEAREVVRAWCREGMDKMGHSGDSVYEQRLAYEEGVIDDKDHWDYLAITSDMVRWARSSDPLPPTPDDPFPMPKRPMRMGSSRGSAGGSLTCYTSRITGINPIGHKLSFERFLNPGRKGIPDIDLDFPGGAKHERRSEVKEYLARKYGRDHVVDVMTISRFTARAAVQQVARIMGIDYVSTKKATDLIDPVHDEDLEALAQSIPELGAWARKWPKAWIHAVRLENGKGMVDAQGNTRADPFCKGVGKHAGGFIISPFPITDHMPTIRADENDASPRTAAAHRPPVSS